MAILTVEQRFQILLDAVRDPKTHWSSIAARYVALSWSDASVADLIGQHMWDTCPHDRKARTPDTQPGLTPRQRGIEIFCQKDEGPSNTLQREAALNAYAVAKHFLIPSAPAPEALPRAPAVRPSVPPPAPQAKGKGSGFPRRLKRET
jgi:hypothetical protein